LESNQLEHDMANANWTPAQIDDEDLRAFIEALAAEGFAGMKPDFEFGILFTPMTGSEAGLRRVMKKLNWVSQLPKFPAILDDDEPNWVYYVMPNSKSLCKPMVGIEPQTGTIYVS
jgi:hypothetical protein